MFDSIVQKISVAVLIAVAIAVFWGLLRLALEHWTFSFLIVALLAGLWYLGVSVKKEYRH